MRRARVLLLFVVAALVAGACSGGGGDSDAGDRTKPEDGEVFLEPLDVVGPDAFTNSVAMAPVPSVATRDASGSGASEGLRTVRGTTAGLFGGSGSQPACDATAAVNALLDNDDKAQAWVDALNDDADLTWSGGSRLAVDDVTTFVGELTPVFLLGDTRVTSHGFTEEAIAFQAVLQRGTAVMVDTRGVPRARCAGFNPLLPPKPAAKPKYRGEQWEGFERTTLVIIEAGQTVETFRVLDVHTKEIIEISVGQGCVCDRTQLSTTTTTLFEDDTTTTSVGRTTTTLRRTTTTARPATTTTVAVTTTVAPTTTTTPPTTSTTAAPAPVP